MMDDGEGLRGRIADAVEDRIMEAFRAEIRKHLFSDKVYPKEVEIRTVYPSCMQTCVIRFEGCQNG